MKKFTEKEKNKGELSARGLSKKAYKLYSETNPMAIYEYEKDGNILYAYDSCFGGNENLTFEELDKELTEIAEDME